MKNVTENKCPRQIRMEFLILDKIIETLNKEVIHLDRLILATDRRAERELRLYSKAYHNPEEKIRIYKLQQKAILETISFLDKRRSQLN